MPGSPCRARVRDAVSHASPPRHRILCPLRTQAIEPRRSEPRLSRNSGTRKHVRRALAQACRYHVREATLRSRWI
ncbi:hypothetical protein GL4_1747 [Methyloceanibacter caenitepidi]|uniref:Uncharacterized protein n=1 Tax=Methyloceanibacter caenitepidi TaxID=1384459 RepID=A0A0A8K317_9HYPH|nr:hypothetical protein GL4_1747 [Methyloceanibacter caenitepidi]